MSDYSTDNPTVTLNQMTAAIAAAPSATAMPPALAKFWAGIALRNSLPAPIFFCGSSTTAADYLSAGNRFVNRFIALLQDSFPLDSGDPQPATVTSMPSLPLANGVQGINLGLSGATSATYLTLTAGARYANDIGDRNPIAVFHQWPMNDYTSPGQIAPATSRTNVQARIDAINSTADNPVLHILLVPYPRWDTAPATYTWDQYVTEAYAMATSPLNTDRVVVCYNTEDFYQNGIGYGHNTSWGSSTYMYDGSVHLGNRGQELLKLLTVKNLGLAIYGGVGVAVGDTEAPTTPVIGAVTSQTSTSMTISVTTQSTDNVAVTKYKAFNAGVQIGGDLTPGASVTPTGLTPDTTYSDITLRAYDAAGNQSNASNSISGATDPGGGGGAVALDAAGTGERVTGSAASISNVFSVAVGAIDNAALLCEFGVSHDNWGDWSTYTTLTAVSDIDGPLTRLVSRSNGPASQRQGSAHQFGLTDATPGVTHNITVTVARSGFTFRSLIGQALSYANVADFSSPTAADVTSASAMNLSVSTATDDMVAICAIFNGDPTGFSETTRYEDGASVTGTGDWLIVGDGTDSSLVTATTTTSHLWAACGVNMVNA